jgi:hypothetical protein
LLFEGNFPILASQDFIKPPKYSMIIDFALDSDQVSPDEQAV